MGTYIKHKSHSLYNRVRHNIDTHYIINILAALCRNLSEDITKTFSFIYKLVMRKSLDMSRGKKCSLKKSNLLATDNGKAILIMYFSLNWICSTYLLYIIVFVCFLLFFYIYIIMNKCLGSSCILWTTSSSSFCPLKDPKDDNLADTVGGWLYDKISFETM